MNVPLGTPQGSVLGPILFLVLVNDITEHITEGEAFLYADDTTVVVSDKTTLGVVEKCNRVFAQMKKWCDGNGLMINFDKTNIIEFYNRPRRPLDTTFNFYGSNLKISKEIKLLGTFLDYQLKWTPEIDSICRKLNNCYFSLFNIKKFMGFESALAYYFSNIFSTLRYNIIVWGKSTEFQRVFVVQKRIIRMLFGLEPRTSCRQIFISHRILTAPCIYLYFLLSYIHEKPGLIRRSAYHSYPTRNNNKINLEKHHHTFFERSPQYSGSRLYNVLPNELKGLENTAFRREIKNLLLKKCFYSVDEFMRFHEDRYP